MANPRVDRVDKLSQFGGILVSFYIPLTLHESAYFSTAILRRLCGSTFGLLATDK